MTAEGSADGFAATSVHGDHSDSLRPIETTSEQLQVLIEKTLPPQYTEFYKPYLPTLTKECNRNQQVIQTSWLGTEMNNTRLAIWLTGCKPEVLRQFSGDRGRSYSLAPGIIVFELSPAFSSYVKKNSSYTHLPEGIGGKYKSGRDLDPALKLYDLIVIYANEKGQYENDKILAHELQHQLFDYMRRNNLLVADTEPDEINSKAFQWLKDETCAYLLNKHQDDEQWYQHKPTSFITPAVLKQVSNRFTPAIANISFMVDLGCANDLNASDLFTPVIHSSNLEHLMSIIEEKCLPSKTLSPQQIRLLKTIWMNSHGNPGIEIVDFMKQYGIILDEDNMYESVVGERTIQEASSTLQKLQELKAITREETNQYQTSNRLVAEHLFANFPEEVKIEITGSDNLRFLPAEKDLETFMENIITLRNIDDEPDMVHYFRKIIHSHPEALSIWESKKPTIVTKLKKDFHESQYSFFYSWEQFNSEIESI